MVLTYDLLEDGRIDDVLLFNHKNYNFLDCDWFKKPIFPTNSLAKLLSDSLLSKKFVIEQFDKLITFKAAV